MIDLTRVIRPGDSLIWGQACAEPQTLLEALIAQRSALSGCSAFLGSSYSGLLRPEHADHLRLTSYCGTGTNRALAEAGALDILPAPYSQLGALLRGGRIGCDVLMLQVSPPNDRGEYSLGLAVEYLAPAFEAARAVIAEVNQQVPWTNSELRLRREGPLPGRARRADAQRAGEHVLGERHQPGTHRDLQQPGQIGRAHV